MRTLVKATAAAGITVLFWSAYALGDSATGGKAEEALKASMAKMHENMMVKYSGDADVDFVRSMIPHHQGAVDMAKIELQYGKDAEIKKLAEQIVQSQEAEIKQMNAWLKQHE